ncbi:hypothetical protein M0805_000392 [Coniferiporia weirii]|nr:hypothetical protein M0805_000392 [Coniferiporia weirii]
MRTQEFARQKQLDNKLTWRQRVVRFGERLFGHSLGERALGSRKRGMTGPIALTEVDKLDHLDRMREAEEARHEREVDKLLDAYATSRRGDLHHSRTFSHNTYDERSGYLLPISRPHAKSTPKSKQGRRSDRDRDVDLNSMSDASMYTYLTGQQRRTADTRQPVRAPAVPTGHLTGLDTRVRDFDRRPSPHHERSRFSSSSYSTSSHTSSARERRGSPGGTYAPTPAEEYALSVVERDQRHGRGRGHAKPRRPEADHDLVDFDDHPDNYEGGRGGYWLRPTHTGTSGSSRNPFRR